MSREFLSVISRIMRLRFEVSMADSERCTPSLSISLSGFSRIPAVSTNSTTTPPRSISALIKSLVVPGTPEVMAKDSFAIVFKEGRLSGIWQPNNADSIALSQLHAFYSLRKQTVYIF